MIPTDIITPRSVSLLNIEIPVDFDRLLYGPPMELEVVIDTEKYVGDIVILWGLISYPKTVKEVRCIRFQGSERFCNKMLGQIRNDLMRLGMDYSETRSLPA
jgi:hypothetical protein